MNFKVHHDLIGGSLAMRDVIRFIQMTARTKTTVLIRGESGTGKELVPVRSISTACDSQVRLSVSAGLRGSQFDQFDVSQASAGLEAGHTSARNSGSKKTTVLPFSFSRESRLFSA